MLQRHPFRSVALRVALIAAGFGLFGALPEVRGDASDVSLLFVTKTQLYLQNSPGNPVLRPNPFAFEAGATPARSNSILGGQFTPPGGTARTLTNLGGGNFFFDGGSNRLTVARAFIDCISLLFAESIRR